MCQLFTCESIFDTWIHSGRENAASHMSDNGQVLTIPFLWDAGHKSLSLSHLYMHTIINAAISYTYCHLIRPQWNPKWNICEGQLTTFWKYVAWTSEIICICSQIAAPTKNSMYLVNYIYWDLPRKWVTYALLWSLVFDGHLLLIIFAWVDKWGCS